MQCGSSVHWSEVHFKIEGETLTLDDNRGDILTLTSNI